MTLPSSPPLSGSQIAAELGLSFPLSMSSSFVLALANKSGFPYSFSDLLGKTGRFDGSRIGQVAGSLFIDLSGQPFFGGTFTNLQCSIGTSTQLFCGTSSSWNGNVLVKNNSTGVSLVLNKISSSPAVWNANSGPTNLIRNGITDSFTILPSN